jgi:hypothetical protein
MPKILRLRKRNSQRINASRASGGVPGLTTEAQARWREAMALAMGLRRFELAYEPSLMQRRVCHE